MPAHIRTNIIERFLFGVAIPHERLPPEKVLLESHAVCALCRYVSKLQLELLQAICLIPVRYDVYCTDSFKSGNYYWNKQGHTLQTVNQPRPGHWRQCMDESLPVERN